MSYEKTTWQTGDIVTAEKLNNIEDGIENAGSLPSVTADDNGDALTVVEGAWAKAEPSSPIVVIDAEDIGNYSYNDIIGYFNAGKMVVLNIGEDEEISLLYLNYIVPACPQYDDPAFVFFGGIADGNPLQLRYKSSTLSNDSPLEFIPNT